MVSPVTGTSSSVVPPSSATPTGSSALGKDQFLKLLMTQMSNQDPTAPQSNEDFIAQLAQFSTLESQQLMTAQLDALLMAAAAENQLAAADLIDKRVAFETETATVKGGDVDGRFVKFAGPADNAIVTLTNDEGETFKVFIPGPHEANSEVEIDLGQFTSSGTIPDGTYSISVTATVGDANPVEATVLGQGLVDGVSYEDGSPRLMLGGLLLAMSDVVMVKSGDTSAVDDAALLLDEGASARDGA
jgi:flagellar basal-body rod modification protein FlgD